MKLLCYDSFDTKFYKRCLYVLNTFLSISGIVPDKDIRICCCGSCLGCHIKVEKSLIEKAFDIITCKEEYDAPMDKAGRFTAAFSSRSNVNIPVINSWALKFKGEIVNFAKDKNIIQKTVNRRFTVVLSHDVDNISDKNLYVFLHRVGKGLGKLGKGEVQKGFSCIIHAAKRLFQTGRSYWDFEEFIELEKSFGFKSTFYFINGRKGRYGARYHLEHVKELMKKIDASSWEVGLHTNYYSYDNQFKISKEKEELEYFLGNKIYGCRNHYLRFKVPETWQMLKNAGLVYDTTLGYSDYPGFRAGIAFPFYPYDLRQERVVEILEIPLVIMDGTLFNSAKSFLEAWDIMKDILDEVKKVNGTIAVNFHTGVFYEKDYLGWKEVYVMMLEYIKSNGGRGVTARELYHEITNEGIFKEFFLK